METVVWLALDAERIDSISWDFIGLHELRRKGASDNARAGLHAIVIVEFMILRFISIYV